MRKWNCVGAVLVLCWGLCAGSLELAAQSKVQASQATNMADWLKETPLQQVAIGRTAQGEILTAWQTAEGATLESDKLRIVLVCPNGKVEPANPALKLLEWFYHSAAGKAYQERFTVAAVPVCQLKSKEAPEWTFPPQGEFYQSPSAMELQYLWRWLEMWGADLVVVLQNDQVPRVLQPIGQKLSSPTADGLIAAEPARDALVVALSQAGLNRELAIPAVELHSGPATWAMAFQSLLDAKLVEPSAARQELQQRRQRTAAEILESLSSSYGKNLSSVVYIPAVALMARVRQAEFEQRPEILEDVERIVAVYADLGEGTLPEKPSSSHLSGHLVFADLARATGEQKYVKLVQNAAGLGFDDNGEPKASMPFHNEMSDSVFMGCPILAAAAALTEEECFAEMMLTHYEFMKKRCLRPDGIYRHSPLDEAAWGRGNGFPALGLTLCLEYLPADAPQRTVIQQACKELLTALLPYQDSFGMWHQVIDRPESYREFSSTCMITYAMARGIRGGWLDEATFGPAIAKAWPAILQRIGRQGEVVDICTGTGKQKTLDDYFLRTAVYGKDDRGGAMAMLLASEMLHRETPAEPNSSSEPVTE